MTDLSPAAQAIMTAIIEISPAPADEIAAAALRAAANQLTSTKAMLQLCAIAAELDAQ